jgi:phosphoglycolate phosphatase-like HAD superfamily hydrolase
MNIFFDVDHTLIDLRDRLRPGVRKLFARLHRDGHAIYLWSGLGKRWEIVERYRLRRFVTDCYDKPLYQYERMLAPLGIGVRPDYVVDDHPHLVHHFGGLVVSRYLEEDLADTEMDRAYAEISRVTAKPLVSRVKSASKPTRTR